MANEITPGSRAYMLKDGKIISVVVKEIRTTYDTNIGTLTGNVYSSIDELLDDLRKNAEQSEPTIKNNEKLG